MLRQQLLLVALLAGTAAGCGSLLAARQETTAAPKTTNLEFVDALAKQLEGDRWQANSEWSAFTEARSNIDGSPDLKRLRWFHAASRAAGDAIRNAELDEALDAENAKHPNAEDLATLAWRDGLAGWNAAILWAQLDPAGAADVATVLEKLVSHPPAYVVESPDKAAKTGLAPMKTADIKPGTSQTISPLMQAAAAEAWCLLLDQEDSDTPMEPILELLRKPILSEQLRSELFLGVARQVPPREIPQLTSSMTSKSQGSSVEKPPVTLRRAAVQACLVYAVKHHNGPPEAIVESWPDTIWNLQWDDDAHVRALFGELLAISAHPKAFPTLKTQLLDSELLVREGALVSLGRMQTTAALEELRKQGERKEDAMRLAVVRGLAAWGPTEIAPFASDSSHLVRREVARQLAPFHNSATAEILRRYLGDSSLDVQIAALDAIVSWPNEFAVPLLLQSLRDGAFTIRQKGLLQLEQRRGSTIQFPLQAGREERVQAAATLAQTWNLASDTVHFLQPHAQPRTDTSNPELDPVRLAEIQGRVAVFAREGAAVADTSVAVDWLRQLTATDLAVVEKLLASVSVAEADILFKEVLARLDPVYGAVAKLEHADVGVRRQGAESLSAAACKASLPLPAIRRMGSTLSHEQDRLVWRFAMGAILKEDLPECADIALLAVNHNWPDIRVLGCEYIAFHGRHAQAGWLLPLFEDSNSSVQLAAVRAAAKCGNPLVLDGQAGAGKGLRPLLESPNSQLRLATAVCMSQFGDAPAIQELTRLSMGDSWTTRRDAIAAMGESGQTRFIEHLVRMAWTESNNDVKRGVVGSLNQLVAASERPAGLETAQTLQQTVEIWVAWWEDQKRAQAARNSPAARPDSVGGSQRNAETGRNGKSLIQ